MSDKRNYRGSTPNTCGYTEAEIEAHAISKSSQLWKVRCLNGSAHKHNDSDPSAFYYPESGWYGCNVCGVQGYAIDRQEINAPSGIKPRLPTQRESFLPKRIPHDATLTATHDYKRIDGSTIHRVKRYDWIESSVDGTKHDRKEYLPEHLNTDHWSIGAGDVQWEPYNAFALSRARYVYIVEGEKCSDALGDVVPDDAAVVTSAFGSGAAHRTNWLAVKEAVDVRGCRIVFVPDRDEAGESYMHSVARLLHLEKINVIRLGDQTRNDGYDIADWLAEGHSFADLPSSIEIQVHAAKEKEPTRNHAIGVHGNGKGIRIHETAYDREIGNLTVDERIERNRNIVAQRVQWLIHQFIAVGQTTIIYGDSGGGKTTLVRSLVRHIVEGSDPFLPNGQCDDDEKDERGRVLWWLGEEDVALTKPKFAAANIDMGDIDMLDRGHKWTCEDTVEIQADGSRQIQSMSSHTDLLNQIDQAAAEGRPYRAIVIDPLSTMIGDTNKADIFERRWDETVVTLESRGLAVIGIVHPRKDNHAGSSLEASLKGTERLFSLPRIVAYVRAAATKALLQQSREQDDGVSHANPIRDRFSATGSGDLSEDRGLIGVLTPLKNSHEPPERLLAWQYSLVIKSLDGKNNVDTNMDAIALFSPIPWRPSDFDLHDLDGRSFGAAVAGRYVLIKREKQTKQEKLASEQLVDRAMEIKTLDDIIPTVFNDQGECSPSKLNERLCDAGFSPTSGAVARARQKIARFDPSKRKWVLHRNQTGG